MDVVVEDLFNGAGDANLTTWTPTPTGTSWVLLSKSDSEQIRIIQGAIRPSSTFTDAHVVYNPLPSPTLADVDVETVLVTIPSGGSKPLLVFARWIDANNWYAVKILNDGNVSMHKNVAGTISEIGAGAALTLATLDAFNLVCSGSTIELYQNGVLKDTATDTSHGAAGICAIGFGNVITSTDDVSFDWDIGSFKVTEFISNAKPVVDVDPGNTPDDLTITGIVGQAITVNFTDSSDADSDPLTKYLLPGDGTALLSAAGNTIDHTFTELGIYEADAYVNDGIEDSDHVTIVFTINDNPQLVTLNGQTVFGGGTAVDALKDASDLTGVDILNGQSIDIEFSALDLAADETLELYVRASDIPGVDPVITSTAILTGTEDQLYQYPVTATDADVGDVLTYSLPVSPLGMTINTSTGLISWTPGDAGVGDSPVTLRVTDQISRFVEQNYTLTVANVNDAPVIDSAAVTSVDEDVAYSYQATVNDPDVGDTATWSLSTSPAGMTISVTGLVGWLPLNDDVGNHAVVISVMDAAGAIGTQSFTLSVANINDAPIITNKGTAPTAAVVGVEYTHNITASDVDNTAGELTLSLVSGPVALDIATGIITYTPSLVADFSYVYRVTDLGFDFDEETVSVTVSDTVAPNVIADLVAVGVSSTDIRLTFTAPGDDDVLGTATVYEIRYANTPIFTQADWDAATQSANNFTPQSVGNAESFVVAGFAGSGQFHFNVRALDDAGNLGALSNANPVAAFLLPSIPGNVQGVVTGPDEITWAWNTVPGAEFYRLLGDTQPNLDANSPVIADNLLAPPYIETGLTPNVMVYRAVVAVTNNS